jgi:hypothetical protein
MRLARTCSWPPTPRIPNHSRSSNSSSALLVWTKQYSRSGCSRRSSAWRFIADDHRRMTRRLRWGRRFVGRFHFEPAVPRARAIARDAPSGRRSTACLTVTSGHDNRQPQAVVREHRETMPTICEDFERHPSKRREYCEGIRSRGRTESREPRRFAGFSSRCHPDLNWGMVVLQTTALPLGYGTDGSVF